MISGSAALSASNTTTGSLSYISELVSGATQQGLYRIIVNNSHINDTMATKLTNVYGYNVTKRNSFMGTYDDYLISWGDITPAPVVRPASSGTIVFNGLDPDSGGSYVAAPTSGLTWLPGTGDFTVEWFQYQTLGGGHPRVFSIGPDTGAKWGVSIEANKVYTWPEANDYAIGKSYVNDWIHVALVRESGMTRCYIDGTQVGTPQADTQNITAGGFDFYIGSDGISDGDGFQGKITNFRWTNDVVYTGSSFTEITSPLEVLTDTKLLLLGGSQSNPVVDSTGINVLDYADTTWSADTPFS
jgi:hypothetical protein